ncbi:MAG: hypothetical protein HRU19_01575 [Pseudobacteriovorax sp.]|nr:hypothetical protein [Pseudobacteriovorax sp.]
MMKTLLCGSILLATTQLQAVTCKTPSSGLQVCEGQGQKAVFIRKMPSWGAQASLAVMEVCKIPDAEAIDLQSDDYLLETVERNPNGYGYQCERQYCSSDHSSFSFAINALTFIIPSVDILEMEVVLSFEWEKVELRCEEFGGPL